MVCVGGQILGCTLRALEAVRVWGVVRAVGADVDAVEQYWRVEVRTCRRGASFEIDCEEDDLIPRNDHLQDALVDILRPSVAHE